MHQFHIKVNVCSNLIKICKIIRNYTQKPIGEIKSKLENGEVVLSVPYLDVDQLRKLREVIDQIQTLDSTIELYRDEFSVTLEYLDNTIISQEDTKKHFEELDELMFGDE